MTHTDQPHQPLAIQVTPIDLVEPDASGRVTRGTRDQIRKLTDEQVREAFGAVEFMAQHAGEMLGRLRERPEQRELSGVEMEFGLGFNSEMKIYIVGAKAEASLKVKLAWKADGAAPTFTQPTDKE
ncbi:MAG TPA: CU044_2847 family protein [Anaerolineae bacterium]|nr:CU044_2847 family protein [Anaerolineae bacterium]HNU03919.1 CU044_2847 family protein [Anaerolineae bacterium]